jgi:hypothetical protein
MGSFCPIRSGREQRSGIFQKRPEILRMCPEYHWDLTQLYRAKDNPALAQHHYDIAHQLFTRLGAKKDLEKIEQAWNN